MNTLTDRVEALFRQCPNQWIDAKVFMNIAGSMAWRTRISEVRSQRGLDIRNRQRRLVMSDGTTFVISEYKFIVPEEESGAVVSVNGDGQASFI